LIEDIDAGNVPGTVVTSAPPAAPSEDTPYLVLSNGGYEGSVRGDFLRINVANYGKSAALNVEILMDGVSKSPVVSGLMVEPGRPKNPEVQITKEPILLAKLDNPMVTVTYRDRYGWTHTGKAPIEQCKGPRGAKFQLRIGEMIDRESTSPAGRARKGALVTELRESAFGVIQCIDALANSIRSGEKSPKFDQNVRRALDHVRDFRRWRCAAEMECVEVSDPLDRLVAAMEVAAEVCQRAPEFLGQGAEAPLVTAGETLREASTATLNAARRVYS
jgi:hypothetical protein